jgi:hypothetical protein
MSTLINSRNASMPNSRRRRTKPITVAAATTPITAPDAPTATV